MATTVEPRTRTWEPETRIVLRRVGWRGYEAMLGIIGDHTPIRITYDRGDMELMSPSTDHERFKMLLDRLILFAALELDIPCDAFASSTWRRRDLERGLEPDQCYYLANSPRIAGKKSIDLDVDPPPDLAVEVEISRSALERMGIYAALRVPEVWRFDGETLRIARLQADGTYTEVDTSVSLPSLSPAEVVRWIGLAEGQSQTAWLRQFRAWVRDELAPRIRDQG